MGKKHLPEIRGSSTPPLKLRYRTMEVRALEIEKGRSLEHGQKVNVYNE